MRKFKSVVRIVLTTVFSGIASTVMSQSHWDTLYPGAPEFASDIWRIAATNGTLYALSYPSTLLSWNVCEGWTQIASFLSTTNQPFGPTVTCLCISGGNLYAAGSFASITPLSCGPTVNATNVAAYNLATGSWSQVGETGFFESNYVNAIAVDTNQNVYISLDPDYSTMFPPGETNAWLSNLVLVYSGGAWQTLGGGLLAYKGYEGGPDGVLAMATGGSDLYITGTFFGGSNSSPASIVWSTNVIKWNATSNEWQAMNAVVGGSSIWTNDSGLVDNWNYDLGTISIAVAGTDVFITGYWAPAGNYPSTNAGINITHFSTDGRWLGTAGYGLSAGDGGIGSGSSLITQNGTIYLGGNFLTFSSNGTNSSTNYNSIAAWTNGQWKNLGSGLGLTGSPYGQVFAGGLAADATSVYLVGSFSTVGGSNFNGNITSGSDSWSVTRWITGADPDPCNCFTYTGELNTATRFPTANLLPNGDVLVAGGYGSTYLSSAERYNWVTGIWTNTGSMNHARTLDASVLLPVQPDGLVLVSGGQSSTDPETLASAELYNWTNGVWSNTGSMNTARQYHTLTVLPNGLVLAAGGWNAAVPDELSSAELYYPETGTWTNTGSMSVAHLDHTATVLPSGLVLVAGGANGGGGVLTNEVATTNADLYYPETGTWTNTGHLNTARTEHTATLLPNGLVLVAGGVNSSSTPISSAELYNPQTGTWTNTGSMFTARYNHRATLLPDGWVLVDGGENSSGAISEGEAYDPSTGTWIMACSLNTARYGHSSALLPDGNVLAAGGDSGSASLLSSELFNFYSTNAVEWTNTSPLNTATRYQTANLLPNGNLLVAGGYNTTYVSNAELYVWQTGTWTNTGSMNHARVLDASVLLPVQPDGLVLVSGGQSSTEPETLASAELYNWTNGLWSITGSMNTARQYHTLTLLPNGLALAAGGWNAAGELSSAELYYPGTGTWTNTGSMSIAHLDHTATVLPNGLVLVAGGANGGGGVLTDEVSTTNATLYYPQTGEWTNTGPLITARAFHTATLLPNGLVLIAGGVNKSGNATNSAELYNPQTREWTATGSMNTPRYHHTANLQPDGLVLVAGGENSTGALSEAEMYDPITGTWTAACSLNTACFGHSATLLPDGNVLVAAGDTGSASTNVAEVYNAGQPVAWP
jgi:hypothetical protein